MTLNGLKPITLFLGENSVGKSTILESLFMVTGPNNPFMSLRVTAQRTHSNISMSDVGFMFYDNKYDNRPQFTATFQNPDEIRKLTLSPGFAIDEKIDTEHISSLGNNNHPLTGLNCHFEIHNNEGTLTGTSSFRKNKDGQLDPFPVADYSETIGSVLLSSYHTNGNFVREYGEIVKSGNKEAILNALQMFDDRITNIESTDEGLYLSYKHLTSMVPLKMAGDGVIKFLSVAIQSLMPSVDIIFIDEIENGLHFSAHLKLWKCIFDFVERQGKQFFITTHNKETLSCLSSILSTNNNRREAVRVVTLARDRQSIVPYYLSGSGLFGAIEDDVEIRR